jgi:hypothetical protein
VKVQNGKTSLEGKDDIAIETTPGGQSKQARVLTGEVVASSPKSLSIRVTDEGEGAEMINVKVGLKTKFIPFRRPAVGERVKVEYTTQDNGEKVGTRVEVK